MILIWLAMLGAAVGVIGLLVYAALLILRRSPEPVRHAGLSPSNALMNDEDSRRIRLQIRRVLLDEWDPIGIKDEPNAQDEYDGYIPRIYELLLKDAPNAELSEYLYWVAHDRMGFEQSKASDMQATVAALRSIPLAAAK